MDQGIGRVMDTPTLSFPAPIPCHPNKTDEEIAKAPEDLRHLLIAESTEDQSTGLPAYSFDLVLVDV